METFWLDDTVATGRTHDDMSEVRSDLFLPRSHADLIATCSHPTHPLLLVPNHTQDEMIKEVDRRRSSRLVRFSNSCVDPDQPRSSIVSSVINPASSVSTPPPSKTSNGPVSSPLRSDPAMPSDAIPRIKAMPVVLDETPEVGNPMDEVIVV